MSRLSRQDTSGWDTFVKERSGGNGGSNPAYPNLILKIGRAFLEAQDEGRHQELYLSEMEAWYLREIVPTNMRVRGEATGLGIKRKLYPLLLDFEAEKYSSLAGSRYGFSLIDEPLTRKDAIIEDEAQTPESATETTEGPQDSESLSESEDVTDLQPEDREQDTQDVNENLSP